MDTFGRLLRDLGSHAGLAALGGHLPQFVRHRTELAGGLLLLDGGLVAGVAAGLVEQVARLARGLGDYLPSLVRGGLGDVAARLTRGPADGRGLVPCDGRSRRLVLRAGTLLSVRLPRSGTLLGVRPHVFGHCGPSYLF